jgi:transcriptional regulator with XRE-family HTH domain
MPPSTTQRRYSQDQLDSFAERLREWRGDHDLTQKDAAARIGVPYRSYQDWERSEGAPNPISAGKLRAAGAPTLVTAANDEVGDLVVSLHQRLDQVLAEVSKLRDDLAGRPKRKRAARRS